MNERIKELAEQAGYQKDMFGIGLSMPECKKFAELIVRECIDVAFRHGDNVVYIADHFGVE